MGSNNINKQCGRRVRLTRYAPDRLQPWSLTVWPCETHMRVASMVGNLPSKFGHTRPLHSEIIRYVRDGWTDRQTDRQDVLWLLRFMDRAAGRVGSKNSWILAGRVGSRLFRVGSDRVAKFGPACNSGSTAHRLDLCEHSVTRLGRSTLLLNSKAPEQMISRTLLELESWI